MPGSESARLAALKAALAASPENVPLLLLYGDGALDALELDEARDAFARVLEIDASQVEARLGIARAHFGLGNTSEAAVRTEQVVSEQPEYAQAHLLLSRILAAEGNRKTAIEHYRIAIALDPEGQDSALAAELGIREETNQLAPAANETPGRSGDGFLFVEDEDGDDDESLPREILNEDGGGSSEGLIERERPKLGFADVGGMEALKEQIRMKILYPLENPDLFKAYGKKAGGGVLVYGPPGCGKTLIARATAGEITGNFIHVGLHEVLDAYIGESEKRLHAIFETARQSTPTVLFFDEIDALAADRRDLRKSAGRNAINQFLIELDSGDNANDGVLVLGATNAPWHIDPAFRRPGRFDRTIFVPPPDEIARTEILKILAKDKPVSEFDAAGLSKRTKGFSGADLKAVFDVAIESTLDRAMKLGGIVPLTNKVLAKAAKATKPSTSAWFESAKNYALYSNQGGFYDEVLEYLGIRSK